MQFTPHNYQKTAIEKILETPYCGLFLDMGLGKTVITLTAIDDLINNRLEVNKVLVIAPLRVARMTWPEELGKWEHLKHLKMALVLGSPAQRKKALEEDADIYVINRENTDWLVNRYGKSWPFDMVVIDELSSFKSNKSKRFKALRKVRPLVNRVVGLTGTPASNGLIDLWPQIYLLDRGERLGKTITGYRKEYFVPNQRNWQTGVVYNYTLQEGAEGKIYKAIEDICVSMKAEDYLTMPELIEIPVKVEMSPAEKKKYLRLEADAVLEVSKTEEITALSAATLSNKLLQMANGAVYYGDGSDKQVHHLHDRKLDVLEELIEEANGKPVIVFYNYKHDLDRIKERFEVRTIDTEEDIKAWNKGEIPILALHPASAGHGLNLQKGGNTIIWFGLNWSLELYLQANARLHRQGQTSTVSCYLIITEGTIDEEVIKALQSKEQVQEALLKNLKARIREE